MIDDVAGQSPIVSRESSLLLLYIERTDHHEDSQHLLQKYRRKYSIECECRWLFNYMESAVSCSIDCWFTELLEKQMKEGYSNRASTAGASPEEAAMDREQQLVLIGLPEC